MRERFSKDEATNDLGLRLRMRSEERRICSQHKQLGILFEWVLDSLEAGGPRKTIGDFLLFQTALEAHMSVEEEIFFPALHGLCNDLEDDLPNLVSEHSDIRTILAGVKQRLHAADTDDSRLALLNLATRINSHERQEEDVISRVTEGPLASLGRMSFEAEV